MVIPRQLSNEEEALISHLTVDEDKVNAIETGTREQTDSDMWKKERTYRFTTSSFQVIAKRQRNHESFAQTIMYPEPFTSKHVAHGIKYDLWLSKSMKSSCSTGKHQLLF